MTSAPAYRRTAADELSWRSDGPSLAWATLGGIVASALIGVPMQMMGMMLDGPAALVGSDSVWVGWLVHLAAGVVFGALYGAVVHTTSFGKGTLYGAAWGIVVGVVFAWLALFTILNMPLFTTAGALDVGMHLAWGIVVGLVSAWGLRRTTEPGAGARRYAGAAP